MKGDDVSETMSAMRIEDHGLISDLHTAALVDRAGCIDWLCLPRFDAPACFAALLGDDRNGSWRIAPSEGEWTSTHAYRDRTVILETTFETGRGVARVIDFMPISGGNHDIVRIVEGVSGEVPLAMQLTIRFDYGRTVPWVHRNDHGIVALAGPDALALHTEVPTYGKGLTTAADLTVRAGERRSFTLTWFRSHLEPPEPAEAERALEDTEKFWRDWSSRCHVTDGAWDEAVVRSLLTLKALTYEPTAGIVAAPTTSLPEHIGGPRNWDYRFCWLRDATFTLYSLMEAGHHEEVRAWTQWLLRAVAGDSSQLQIMYGVAGERSLPELELPWLSGYKESRPVRIGNAAAEQFQLDVYGEVMDTLHLARTLKIDVGEDAWRLQRHLIAYVIEHWTEPDEGIWEIRGPRRHFTHSKLMAWVALDRGIKSVEKFGLKGDVARWRQVRDEIHADVCQRGYSRRRRAFVQFYETELLDASLLMLPLVGFLPPEDERVVSTIEAIARDLSVDGLILRYRTDAEGSVDGLPAGEGAFLPCSFWLVDCLHLIGRVDEARERFNKLLSLRNPLGLLAEEYDPRGRRMLGNFPQAFSHVALINSARNLSQHTGPARHRGTEG